MFQITQNSLKNNQYGKTAQKLKWSKASKTAIEAKEAKQMFYEKHFSDQKVPNGF